MNDIVWGKLLVDAEVQGLVDHATMIAVKIYGGSANFDDADRRFTRFVRPALLKMSAPAMRALLAAIEGNPQTYGRGRSKLDHPQVKAVAGGLMIDTKEYKNFTEFL